MEKKRSGFTLIEMLIVAAIIGLLSSIIIVGLGSSRAKARDARRISDIQQIAKWAELNYQDVSGYPTTNGSGITNGPLGDSTDSYSWTRGGSPMGQTVTIGACLEDATNAQATTTCNGYPTESCASQRYFCVTLSGNR